MTRLIVCLLPVSLLSAGLLLLVSVAGCQGAQQDIQDARTTMPAFDSIPLPGELSRLSSYTDTDRIKLGAEFDSLLPTNLVAIAGNYLLFRPYYNPELHPLYNGTAYAIYSFEVDGYSDDPTVAYRWYSKSDYDDSLWLGLANWDLNAWEWYRCDASELLTLPSMAPYLNPDGHVLAAAVAYDPEQDVEGTNYSVLQYIRLGQRIGRWIVDVVDPEATTSMVSLAMGNEVVPHIAYLDFVTGNAGLKYASLGFGWHVEEVDTEGDTGYYPSIIMEDDNGFMLPRICYRSQTDNNLRIAISHRRMIGDGDYSIYWGEFPMEVDVPHPASCNLISINDTYAVSYQNFDTNRLQYAYFNGLDWINTIVDDTAENGFTNWMTIGPSGQPCISYRSESGPSLKYAEFTGFEWNLSTVEDGGGDEIAMVSCLRFGPDNQPQICYDDLTHDSTHWAYYDGADWHSEMVYDLEEHAQNKALVIDSAGVPHIATMDSEHNTLKHFWRVPEGPDWLSESVDFGGSYATGYCVAMQIDSEDRLYIAYGGYHEPGAEYALKFAYQVD